MTADPNMVSTSPLCCYGAQAMDWAKALYHADPTMQGIAEEYRAAIAAYRAALDAARKETPQ